MSAFRRLSGWLLCALSLGLCLFTVLCFWQQPDIFAAFTVLPFWVWGGAGLLMALAAFRMLRKPLVLALVALWAVALAVGSDEARALKHLGKETPRKGAALPHEGKKVIRVLTANTAMFKYGDPSAEIAAWQPDIVLFQQTMPHHVKQMAEKLYGGTGDFRTQWTNGIATRWKISKETRNNQLRCQLAAVALPDGRQIEIANLHLATAATDLRLWSYYAWREHKRNRRLRREEIAGGLKLLEQTTGFPDVPTILGGDFNAPATDVVHRQLAPHLADAFSEAGTGWGDTFHRRLPILRIDHVYATRHLTPVRCSAVDTRHSDHRFVVADYVLR